jgi:hypothetical protein
VRKHANTTGFARVEAEELGFNGVKHEVFTGDILSVVFNT